MKKLNVICRFPVVKIIKQFFIMLVLLGSNPSASNAAAIMEKGASAARILRPVTLRHIEQLIGHGLIEPRINAWHMLRKFGEENPKQEDIFAVSVSSRNVGNIISMATEGDLMLRKNLAFIMTSGIRVGEILCVKPLKTTAEPPEEIRGLGLYSWEINRKSPLETTIGDDFLISRGHKVLSSLGKGMDPKSKWEIRPIEPER